MQWPEMFQSAPHNAYELPTNILHFLSLLLLLPMLLLLLLLPMLLLLPLSGCRHPVA
jgi:hypothetical protein